MKEYVKKLALAMIAGIIIILVGAFALDKVLEMYGARERSISSENKYITNFYRRGGMIGHGKDGLSVTPVGPKRTIFLVFSRKGLLIIVDVILFIA